MHNGLHKIKNTFMLVLYGIIVLITTQKFRQQAREAALEKRANRGS